MSVTIRKGKTSISEIVKNMNKIDDADVYVGIRDKGSSPEDNLAYRMIIHELGYVVPRAYGGGPEVSVRARPVFHTTYLDNKQKLHNFMHKTLAPKLILGEITQKEAKDMLGAWYSGKLKEQFRKRKFARLSRYYKIRPSGKTVTSSSIPLIDNGEMRNAIEWW